MSRKRRRGTTCRFKIVAALIAIMPAHSLDKIETIKLKIHPSRDGNIKHITDSKIVTNIKNVLKAGSVKLRSHSNSIRYRVKQKSVIIDIINRLNGKLYNPARLEQFQKVCQLLNISLVAAPILLEKLNKEHCYFKEKEY